MSEAEAEPGTVNGPLAITIRAPTTTGTSSGTFTPPPLPWLLGTWHVTHSTLSLWKKRRNVCITYKPLPGDASRLDDLVTYQSLTSDKVKSIPGIDTPAGPGCWDWRGIGWLVIISSHWEVLAYGGEEGAEQWVVTYFEKTLFTPAGVDLYSRGKEGLSQGTVERVMEALKKVDVVKDLVKDIFVVKSD